MHRGTGYIKWKILQHIAHKAGANDIVVIIDNCAVFASQDALASIAKRFILTKCWITYGQTNGTRYVCGLQALHCCGQRTQTITQHTVTIRSVDVLSSAVLQFLNSALHLGITLVVLQQTRQIRVEQIMKESNHCSVTLLNWIMPAQT